MQRIRAEYRKQFFISKIRLDKNVNFYNPTIRALKFIYIASNTLKLRNENDCNSRSAKTYLNISFRARSRELRKKFNDNKNKKRIPAKKACESNARFAFPSSLEYPEGIGGRGARNGTQICPINGHAERGNTHER